MLAWIRRDCASNPSCRVRSSWRCTPPNRVRPCTSSLPIPPCCRYASCSSTWVTCAASGRIDVNDYPPIRLVHLYPDLMSVYGDRGNVLALCRRAEWRDIAVTVQELSLG